MFSNTSRPFTALAIILGSGLVALSIYQTNAQELADGTITIQRAEAAERHLYGSPQAETVIVEFSDYQCPFCARIHPEIKDIVDSSNGTIAWEYRHLPLQNHPLAAPAAGISECIHDQKGNEAFWRFTDRLFENQRAISQEFIMAEAQAVGLSDDDLERCMASEAIIGRVETDTAAAVALGGSGTPFSVIVYPDNTYKTVPGAVPREHWDSLLEYAK